MDDSELDEDHDNETKMTIKLFRDGTSKCMMTVTKTWQFVKE